MIVGVPKLGYDVRPRYKRKPGKIATADWRPIRAAACDELVARVADLSTFEPPIDLRSHEATRKLVEEPSPLADARVCWTPRSARGRRPTGASRCAVWAPRILLTPTVCRPRSSRPGESPSRRVDPSRRIGVPRRPDPLREKGAVSAAPSPAPTHGPAATAPLQNVRIFGIEITGLYRETSAL
jgi:hypothetical protein